jgi:uncharacterized protein YqeY
MLKDTINADLKAAMLARDTLKTQTLQGLKSAILYEEVAKKVRETGLDDAQIEQLIAREVKKRNESATVFESAGRTELVENEKAEAAILVKYLPTQATEAEIKSAIDELKTELAVLNMSQMGQLIGAVKSKFGNGADGALIAKLVKESLI